MGGPQPSAPKTFPRVLHFSNATRDRAPAVHTHTREMVSGIFHALFGAAAKTSVRSFFDFKDVRDIDGSVHDFGQHRGKVIVVSNTASY